MSEQSTLECASVVVIHTAVTGLLELLDLADSVVIDSPRLESWECSAPDGTPDNEVVAFRWLDEGRAYSVKLTEGGIAEGRWYGGSFFCKDSEGDDVQLCLYLHVPLTPDDLPEALSLSLG